MACLSKLNFLDKSKLPFHAHQTSSINMKTALSLSSVLAISTIAISSISTSAFAKDGAFVLGNIGYSSGKYTVSASNVSGSLTLDSAPVYGVGYGYNKNQWSFIGTYDYRSLSYLSSDIKSHFVLANALYNFKPFANKVNLYFGGGLGVAQTTADSISKNGIAMQLQFGAKMPVNTNLDVFADVRSTAASYTTGSVTETFSYGSLNIGAKYNF